MLTSSLFQYKLILTFLDMDLVIRWYKDMGTRKVPRGLDKLYTEFLKVLLRIGTSPDIPKDSQWMSEKVGWWWGGTKSSAGTQDHKQ